MRFERPERVSLKEINFPTFELRELAVEFNRLLLYASSIDDQSPVWRWECLRGLRMFRREVGARYFDLPSADPIRFAIAGLIDDFRNRLGLKS